MNIWVHVKIMSALSVVNDGQNGDLSLGIIHNIKLKGVWHVVASVTLVIV